MSTFTLHGYQVAVASWLRKCFGVQLATDKEERNQRFFEEACELVQANGMSQSAAHRLVDYVYGREVGEVSQEIAGVMVSLSALAETAGVSISEAANAELERINRPEMIVKINEKQKLKPRFLNQQ